MKISLTAQLIIIMVLSIFLSSLVSILFVSSFSVRQIRGINLKRDMEISVLVAESLSTAADRGELFESIASLGSPRSRMGPGMMRSRPGTSVLLDDQGTPIPLLITDHTGKVLQGMYRGSHDSHMNYLKSEYFKQGAPYYLDGRIAGYVLAGNLAGQNERQEDLSQISAMIKTVLMYPIFSAILASFLGIFLLRRALLPLKSLQLGVQTVQKGEYSYRVSIPESKFTIRDDLTTLSEGFNRMAASLEASKEWKKQIISDTAHELRTPVSLIMGNLEMILDGVYKADQKRLESLYRESSALGELISKLQILASEESKDSPMEMKEFSLTDLVSHTADDFRALALQKKIAIHFENKAELLFTGDINKTRQVLKNLMANALKFTDENGSISLRCLQQNDKLIVEIEDSGVGIPVEYREKIFNRFYKIDKSRNSEGSGLGLSISRAIIENQGGTLTADEGFLKGALFRITFPVHKAD